MTDVYAVLNAGSSSIKFSLFEAPGLEAGVRGQVEGIYTAPRFVAKEPSGRVIAERSWPQGTSLGHEGALWHIVDHLREHLSGGRLAGIGHRVVHGGLRYTHPVRVDAAVVATLSEFVPLAPLHQPHNLTPIRLLLERLPQVPQVACFDTAFHRGAPPVSQRFAIELYVYRIRRELGSLTAALGGLDALVFTAGIGENATAIRAAVCRDAQWLGLELDAAANERAGPRISSASSRVSAWVLPTNEELMIAQHTRRLIGAV